MKLQCAVRNWSFCCKHHNNCECCSVSLFIARSLWNGRSPSRSFIRGRSVDFYTLFVEPDRQIVLIIMTISVEMVYEKKHSNNGFKTFTSQEFQPILSIFLTHQTTRFPTIIVEQQIESIFIQIVLIKKIMAIFLVNYFNRSCLTNKYSRSLYR